MSYQLQILPVGLSCPLLPEQTVLDAALADGLMLKHSCRTGTCGSCKGQVLSGEVEHGDSPLEVLSAAERARGLALFCCATARSDLVIEAPEVTALRGIGIQQMGVRVASLDKVSSDVAVLRLTLAPGAGFTYFPGQYVQVLLKDGSRRSYSMATHAPGTTSWSCTSGTCPAGCSAGMCSTPCNPRPSCAWKARSARSTCATASGR
ncbi:MAG: 2Fe-2S iron-sulfur cluster-binding protein [Pseudomonas veronii]|jgi:CDP-4-dehydro-6-deoxyglucose reductase|nr:2Fe-2S iron-sulfur cluster-binding protein [Pseudomonas veronii]